MEFRKWQIPAAAILVGGLLAAAAATADPPSKDVKILPSRVPVHGVMAGMIDRASFRIFSLATSDRKFADTDWLEVGMAAVNLVGAATLITLPDNRAQDATWLADPAWLPAAREMQDAAVAVGLASSNQDRAALSQSSARLAQSCQSCHMKFSERLVSGETAPASKPSKPH
jgi:cytochrome c556